MKRAKIIAGILVIAAAAAVSYYWLTNRPRAERRAVEKKARLVEIRSVESKDHTVTVHAMGTVVPREAVDVVARVSGNLTEVSDDLIPGGFVDHGEVLARVDQSDYKLDVARARERLKQAERTCEERKQDIERSKSKVAQARTELVLERAKQAVARHEYEMLSQAPAKTEGGGVSAGTESTIMAGSNPVGMYGSLRQSISEDEKKLILREPQLKASQATLKSAIAGREKSKAAYNRALAARDEAKVALERAELKFDWTTIEAPFDAVVKTKHVGVGSNVSRGQPVASLVNTDTYWVELSVPVAQLRWIQVPDDQTDGAPVRIYQPAAWGESRYRRGRVLRVEPAVEKEGRMARVVVAVKDPLSRRPSDGDKPRLLLNSYVEAQIRGRTLSNAIQIPRSVLRNGSEVWIMSPDDTLNIQDVTIAVRAPDAVYVTGGLEEGDRIVSSDIPSAVAGMALRTGQPDAGADSTSQPADKTTTKPDAGSGESG